MQATLSQSPLNAIQRHLLQMFSYTHQEESLQELKSVLFNYYRNKLSTQTNEFWQNNNLDDAKMEEIMYGHNRISAK